MLVSHWWRLEEVEGLPFSREMVVQGAEERLAPIRMTGLCTALARLPIIVSGNKPGHEIKHPRAVVIFGGLLTATLRNSVRDAFAVSRVGRRPAIQPARANEAKS